MRRSGAGSPRPTVIGEAAPVVGGGGGGRDDMAQAGGRDPSKLDDALTAARDAIERGWTETGDDDADSRPRLRQRPDRLRRLRPQRHPGAAAGR